MVQRIKDNHLLTEYSWDSKWFYFEHKYHVGSTVYAIGYARFVCKKGRDDIPPAEFLKQLGVNVDDVNITSKLPELVKQLEGEFGIDNKKQ